MRSRVGWAVVLLALFAACSSATSSGMPDPQPQPQPQPQVQPGPPPTPPYSGPASLGPCATDADCRTRDVCGCSCEPMLRTVAMGPSACSETCPGDGCAGKVARCDTSTHQCVVVPAAVAPPVTPHPVEAPS